MRRASLCVWAAVALASCVSNAVAPTPAPLREFVPQPSPLIAPASESPTATPSATATVGVRLAAATGDFDCDGRSDGIEFFERVAPADGLPRLARLSLSTGAVYELAFAGVPQTDDAAANPLIGIADVNGDRCDDAIVSVGHGASTTWTVIPVPARDLEPPDSERYWGLSCGSVKLLG